MKRPLTQTEIDDIVSQLVPYGAFKPTILDQLKFRIQSQCRAQLARISIYPEMIPELKEQLVRQYFDSQVQPGECVGILTAQSIGEKQTQNTLNSVIGLTEILVRNDTTVHKVYIGEWIDDLLYTHKSTHFSESRTDYLELVDPYYIPSPDKRGRMEWRRIEAVTRHVPIGNLIKIKTQSGREATATRQHSFLIWDGSAFVPTMGENLVIGDVVPTTRFLPHVELTNRLDMKKFTTLRYIRRNNIRGWFTTNYEIEFLVDTIPEYIPLDGEFGFLYGMHMTQLQYTTTSIALRSDDTAVIGRLKQWCERYTIPYYIIRNRIQIRSTVFTQFIASRIDFEYGAPIAFIKGLFDGLVSGKRKDIIKLRCGLEKIQCLLTYIGVFSRIVDRKLVIQTTKENGTDVYFDKIVSIEETPPTQFVYDLTVSDTRNFSLLNGLGVRDTFHKAGLSAASVITGIPRFSELINATPNPKGPITNIFFKERFGSYREIRAAVHHKLLYTQLDQLVLSYTPTRSKRRLWYAAFFNLTKITPNWADYPIGISLKFSPNMLFERRATLKAIAEAIAYNIKESFCIYAPDNIGCVDVWIHPKHYAQKKTKDTATPLYKTVIQPLTRVRNALYTKLLSIKISGIYGLDSIFYEEHPNHGWYVTAKGCNLPEILAKPYINAPLTFSDHMWEINSTLGIEAVREFLIKEFVNVISSDSYINLRHIQLLVDVMTFTGSISSISRFGVQRNQSGPISKASFEETLDNFLKAGLYGDVESTNGISASIVCGKPSVAGTGMSTLLYTPKLNGDAT